LNWLRPLFEPPNLYNALLLLPVYRRRMRDSAFSRYIAGRLEYRLILGGLFAAFTVAGALAQSASTPTAAQQKGVSMQKFAFIFRQSNVPLDETQQKRRAEEVRRWAIHLRDEGHVLEPHLLGEERYVAQPGTTDVSPQSRQPGDPVVAILILDATSFDEARKIAATHPGLRYGVSIEVRAATVPSFPPVPAAVTQ
jgi:hypothetical protein